MCEEDERKTIFAIHREFGCPLWEARKAHDLIRKYIGLRHPLGDHPEDYIPLEYDLVEK